MGNEKFEEKEKWRDVSGRGFHTKSSFSTFSNESWLLSVKLSMCRKTCLSLCIITLTWSCRSRSLSPQLDCENLRVKTAFCSLFYHNTKANVWNVGAALSSFVEKPISSTKASTVFPREHIGHSKHPLPTTQEKTLHMDITRWSIPKSDWLYSLQPKMEKLYTVSKNKTGSWLCLRSWTPCQIDLKWRK